METNTKTKALDSKINFIEEHNSENNFFKERITSNSIIISAGILFSFILFLIQISCANLDWKIPFIPLMVALQLIFLLSALKNRFKKL
ncbi:MULTISPECIES: hypothetical protein [unclassified Flavobacterium]|jgi:hypothetical protein|uniref:hypothetical protein n=1 Tax=unclassified Flavobacterium TaxID=196869 RepID=UPI0025B96D65|nr:MULTISPECIES: hypothetical protein [unclassified Flavobacterium]